MDDLGRTSGPRSSRRSRSGGSFNRSPDSRASRSLRKVPSRTLCPRSRFVAATTRRSTASGRVPPTGHREGNLPLELLQGPGPLGELPPEDLERDALAQLEILCLVDLAHAPAAEQPRMR